MKLYHTFESSKGFDINHYDYERGIFCINPWWVGKKGYEKYSAFTPNEFGDKVVEITIKNNVKIYQTLEQLTLLEKLFPNSENTKKIIKKFEMGNFEREDWQKMDKFIGRLLIKKGYKLIHYSETEMYGDEWVIISKDIIEEVRYEN